MPTLEMLMDGRPIITADMVTDVRINNDNVMKAIANTPVLTKAQLGQLIPAPTPTAVKYDYTYSMGGYVPHATVKINNPQPTVPIKKWETQTPCSCGKCMPKYGSNRGFVAPRRQGNKANIRKWVDELRCGKYRQTTSEMMQWRYGDDNSVMHLTHCVFGVAIETAMRNGAPLRRDGDQFYSTDAAYLNHATPELVTTEWLGLGASVYAMTAEYGDVDVISLNDSQHWSFDRIADAIEATYLTGQEEVPEIVIPDDASELTESDMTEEKVLVSA